MNKPITILISCFAVISAGRAAGQAIEDSTLGPRPTIKMESLSPAGHCDNLQLTFSAPWADHYEIAKRRSDTGWINENKQSNAWFSQTLKPHVNGLIYKNLDEQGAYQFIVKAYKGNRYRQSEVVTRQACINP